jgi:hypothetical protein
MANESVSIEQNKSIVESLECSPSLHDSGSHPGGKAKITVGGKAAPSKTALATPESEFQYKGVPGYKGGFAKGATQE